MVFMDATTKKRRRTTTSSSSCACMMILDVQSSSYLDCFLFHYYRIDVFQFLIIILNYCCFGDLLSKE
jgi:hypothetical protein